MIQELKIFLTKNYKQNFFEEYDWHDRPTDSSHSPGMFEQTNPLVFLATK